MKKLELSQMENTQAGWSWGGCGTGALLAEYQWGAAAEVFLPGLGALGVGAIGCLFGGEAL